MAQTELLQITTKPKLPRHTTRWLIVGRKCVTADTRGSVLKTVEGHSREKRERRQRALGISSFPSAKIRHTGPVRQAHFSFCSHGELVFYRIFFSGVDKVCHSFLGRSVETVCSLLGCWAMCARADARRALSARAGAEMTAGSRCQSDSFVQVRQTEVLRDFHENNKVIH